MPKPTAVERRGRWALPISFSIQIYQGEGQGPVERVTCSFSDAGGQVAAGAQEGPEGGSRTDPKACSSFGSFQTLQGPQEHRERMDILPGGSEKTKFLSVFLCLLQNRKGSKFRLVFYICKSSLVFAGWPSPCSTPHHLPFGSVPSTQTPTQLSTTVATTHASPIRRRLADHRGTCFMKTAPPQRMEVLWEEMSNTTLMSETTVWIHVLEEIYKRGWRVEESKDTEWRLRDTHQRSLLISLCTLAREHSGLKLPCL